MSLGTRGIGEVRQRKPPLRVVKGAGPGGGEVFFDISEKIPLNECYYVRGTVEVRQQRKPPLRGVKGGGGGSIFYPISLKFGMYM